MTDRNEESTQKKSRQLDFKVCPIPVFPKFQELSKNSCFYLGYGAGQRSRDNWTRSSWPSPSRWRLACLEICFGGFCHWWYCLGLAWFPERKIQFKRSSFKNFQYVCYRDVKGPPLCYGIFLPFKPYSEFNPSLAALIGMETSNFRFDIICKVKNTSRRGWKNGYLNIVIRTHKEHLA